VTDNITLRRAVVEQVRETLEKSAVRFFSLAAYISPIESVNGVKPSRGREDVIAALAAIEAALAEPDAIARAVEAEREACAKVCETGVDTEHPIVKGHIMQNFGQSKLLARAIRARGSK
jgi:hypothetical protein